jgi:hypothetical protein
MYMAWVYLMQHKFEACSLLQSFINLVENQFSTTIKIICSDNGPEFTIPSFYSDKEIIHQTNCVSTPQRNGVVERKHRHLLNMSRALLFQARLPTKFWGDAILTTAYLINRTPTPLLSDKTLYEALHNFKPQYNHLQVFSCLCFASTHSQNPSKFAPHAIRCVFLGYPYSQKGYRLYDLDHHKTFISCDVLYYKDHFLFSQTTLKPSSPVLPFPYPFLLTSLMMSLLTCHLLSKPRLPLPPLKLPIPTFDHSAIHSVDLGTCIRA